MTREDAETLFDLMEAYREEHPDATDDECWEAVIWGWRMYNAPTFKDERDDRSIYA